MQMNKTCKLGMSIFKADILTKKMVSPLLEFYTASKNLAFSIEFFLVIVPFKTMLL